MNIAAAAAPNYILLQYYTTRPTICISTDEPLTISSHTPIPDHQGPRSVPRLWVVPLTRQLGARILIFFFFFCLPTPPTHRRYSVAAYYYYPYCSLQRVIITKRYPANADRSESDEFKQTP